MSALYTAAYRGVTVYNCSVSLTSYTVVDVTTVIAVGNDLVGLLTHDIEVLHRGCILLSELQKILTQ